MNNMTDIFAGKVPGVKKMDETKVVQEAVGNVDINSKIYGNVMGRGSNILSAEQRAHTKSFIQSTERKSKGSEQLGKTDIDVKEIIGMGSTGEKRSFANIEKSFDVGKIIGIGKGSFKSNNFEEMMFGAKKRIKAGSKAKNVPQEFNVHNIIYGTTQKGKTAERSVHNILYGSNTQMKSIMGDVKSKSLDTGRGRIQQILGTSPGAYGNRIQRILGTGSKNVTTKTGIGNTSTRIKMMLGHTPHVDMYGRNLDEESPVEVVHTDQPVVAGAFKEERTYEEAAEKPSLLSRAAGFLGKVAAVPSYLKGEAQAGYKAGYKEVAGVEPEERKSVGFLGELGREAKTFFGVKEELTPEEIQFAEKIALEQKMPVEGVIAAMKQRKGVKILAKDSKGDQELGLMKVMASYFSRKGSTIEGARELERMYRRATGMAEVKSPFRQFTSQIGGGISDITRALPSVEQAAMRLTPSSTGMGLLTSVSGVAAQPMTPSKVQMLVGGFGGQGQGYFARRGVSGLGMASLSTSAEPVMPQYTEAPQPVPVSIPMATSEYVEQPDGTRVWSPYTKRLVSYRRGPYKKRVVSYPPSYQYQT